MKLWGLAVVAAVSLAGCMSTGVQVKDEQLASFTPGQTTKADVITALGNPTTQTRNADGTSMLMYMYTEASARPETYIPIVGAFIGGADSRSNVVTLTFDADGKLVNHSSSESQYGTGMGFSAGNVEPVVNQPRKP